MRESPPPSRADELLAGKFTFLVATRNLGERPAWNFRGPGCASHLWRFNLHYHRFLVDAAVEVVRCPESAGRILGRAILLLDDWSAACPAGDPGSWSDAWSSYAVSTRLLNAWLARLLLLPVSGPQARDLARRLDSLGASSALFLSRWLERDIGGNHLLRNASALTAAGAWFEGPDGAAWAALGRRLLLRELSEQVLPDGFHYERSPMYHCLALEDLLLSSLACPASPELAEEAARWCSRLLDALPTVVHPDGEIALFNDSALGICAPPPALQALAAGLGVARGSGVGLDLPDAGYFRLGSGANALILDAGRFGPDHLPAHAHCDALSFELSLGGRRVVVDTGVDRYEAGPDRDFQRSTSAHATLQIGDLEQGEPFGGFRMGRRPKVRGRRIDGATVSGEHDGFGSAGVHRRVVRWEGGGDVVWSDRVDGPREVPVAVRVGLVPEASVIAGSTRAVARVGGDEIELTLPSDGSAVVEDGIYCERFGSRVHRNVIVWKGTGGRDREHVFRLSRRPTGSGRIIAG